MPHSSGGGSHGGGGHGGSHGGSHGRSGPRISRSHFPGSRRYVYYRHNQPRYFYAGKNFKPGFDWKRLFVLLFYIPFFFVGFRMLREVIGFVPKNYDHSIIIEDDADVINNKSELRSTLESFMDKTGVAPSVVTVNNEEWQNVYPSLENYAYHRYLQEFNDEMHWLIVYSQPRDPDPNFNDWFWEGMQGDYTDGVLTSSDTSRFNTVFNSYLGSNESFDDAVIKSFAYITDNISMSPDPIDLIIPVAVLFFAVILTIITIYKSIKYRNASPAPLENDLSAAYSSSVPYSGGYNPANARSAAYTGNDNSRDLPDEMPSLDAIPSAPHHAPAERSVNCQYCGCSFTDKYSRCPFCNAKR